MGKHNLSERPARSWDEIDNMPTTEKKQPVHEPKEDFIALPTNLVVAGENIRHEYNEESINELANSIKEYGQLQAVRVYEKNGQFMIIFGHRRLLACKQLGLKEIKANLVKEPNSFDIIYQQIIENEQSEKLSDEDRESYIKLLRDKGKSFKEIAVKICKSESWIRECEKAANVREQFQPFLNFSGLTLSTHETNWLRNATEDEVKKAVELVVEHPENKTEILKNVNKNNIKKKNVGAKKKNNFFLLSLDKMEINIEINFDKEKKVIYFHKKNINDFNEEEINSLLDILSGILQKRGYQFTNEI